MSEVAVAFPNDETSAEVVATQLRAEGIAARVDRGLSGSYQVPSRGHMTVVVQERDAARAHEVLGTRPREERPPGVVFRLAIGLLVLVLGFALVAVVMTVAR